MDFIKDIDNGDELIKILNTAIDKIYKKEENIPKLPNVTHDELSYISNIFSQYCSNHLTKSELLDYFQLDPEMKDIVLKVIENRKPQVAKHLLKVHNAQQIPLMTSFDWDLKFITGNSSLASHREMKSTLIFECDIKDSTEMLSIEMNKEMLDKMIYELESVSAVE